MVHKVLIMKCETYDPVKIARILEAGMEELGVEPHGNTLLKPNCVISHPELFPHAFTRKEFLEGAVVAVKRKSANVKELSVGERSGITVPTRFCFKNAGYDELIAEYGLKSHFFDESLQVPFHLKNPMKLRDVIYVPEPITRCDFFINLPKFKAHPWTRLTLGLKNYIGLQDDRHRLVDHNCFLENKIADLQEVIQPGFIAVDAIIAGQKMMLTPTPFPMGAIVMGTNSCAVDAVCCRMVNVDPKDLIHLKLASERGFGPIALDEIEVAGDFPLSEVQEKCKTFEFCLEKIDSYFSTGKIRCVVGSFPESHSRDYCWGGCPGALQEAVHIIRNYYPGIESRMKKVLYVVGKIEKPIEVEDDEKVVFVGDCTSWEGKIGKKHVRIEDLYSDRRNLDVRKAPSHDMVTKILGSYLHCLTRKGSRYMRAAGCPVSVAAHVNFLSSLAGIKNVNFDFRNLIPINVAYLKMRSARIYNKIR